MNNSILIVMIAMVMNKINKTGTAVKRMIFCSIDVGLEVLEGATVTLLVLLIVVVVMITAVE